MIELNKVGIEIDGKVYEFYKISFGFQRKLIEVQSNLDKMTNEIAKKYEIDVKEVNTSDKVSNTEKLALARTSFEMQDALAGLFVNEKEAVILDKLSTDNVSELITALQ